MKSWPDRRTLNFLQHHKWIFFQKAVLSQLNWSKCPTGVQRDDVTSNECKIRNVSYCTNRESGSIRLTNCGCSGVFNNLSMSPDGIEFWAMNVQKEIKTSTDSTVDCIQWNNLNSLSTLLWLPCDDRRSAMECNNVFTRFTQSNLRVSRRCCSPDGTEKAADNDDRRLLWWVLLGHKWLILLRVPSECDELLTLCNRETNQGKQSFPDYRWLGQSIRSR
jgi:hypothetical protein